MHLQYRQTIRSLGVTVYIKLLGVITESDSIHFIRHISLCFCFIENSLKTSNRCVHCVLFRSTYPATYSSCWFCGDFSLTFLLSWCPPVLCGALSCFILKVSCSASFVSLVQSRTSTQWSTLADFSDVTRLVSSRALMSTCLKTSCLMLRTSLWIVGLFLNVCGFLVSTSVCFFVSSLCFSS